VRATWEFQPFLQVKGFLRDISLNGDGLLLATATKYFDNSTDDGEHVIVWDLTSKKQICNLHGLNIAFSTMDTLGTAASDGISLWNARTCNLIKSFPPNPEYPKRYPYNITFSPDGKLLALALHGNVVEILDTSSGEVVQKLNVVFDYANYIRFSPDGKFFVTISRNEDSPEIETILIVWKIANDSQEPIEISPEFFDPIN
jgi:WD40 repeat protein